MKKSCEKRGCLQTTQSKDTAQCYLLCLSLMKTPDEWDWENEKSPICDDIGNRIADKECVDVHRTSRVYGFIPLGGR